MDQGLVEVSSRFDLRVGGMHCASCVGRVERAAAAVPGVRSVSVNLATERATIDASDMLRWPDLAAAVSRAGYALALPEQPDPPDRFQHDGRSALLALALAAPLVLPMALLPFGIDAALPGVAQFALAAVIQIWFGARFYRGAFLALRAGTGSMDTLVALGTTAAFGLSVWELWQGRDTHLYFEASAAVIALVRLGKYLEARSRREAGAAIRALQALRPVRARIRQGAAERDIPIGELLRGDLLVIRPGERIAADAVVREGDGTADESLLTGEALPVAKQPGDRLIGGAVNGPAQLLAEVTAVGAETQLSRMVRLVESAQGSKPPVQYLVDRVSAVFVPLVIVLAMATLAGWWFAGMGAETAIVRAVAVLVIACPCAMGLATPAAIMVGTGVAAGHGILIRDGAALERVRALKTVIFDKTGTLTNETVLRTVSPADGITDDAALRLAAALAGGAHPLDRAIRARSTMALPAASALRALPGRGVQGVVDGRALVLGSRKWMLELGFTPSEADGATRSYLAESGGRLLAEFSFEDALKPNAAAAVGALQAAGLRIVLLTGDSRAAAMAVADALRIPETRAEILPEEKARIVTELRRDGAVAMVGDGVNDAPALAAADLGLAMATGSDAAMAAADITLLRGDPILVPAALDIARRTTARIRSNLAWAFAYNLIGLPLAASGLLSPMLAGAAMALSSVAVMGNALLLRRWRPVPHAR